MDRYKNILLIESDKHDQEVFEDRLHDVAPNAQLLTAGQGKQALDFLHAFRSKIPGVIFSTMPVSDSCEFMEALKQSADYKLFRDIPIVLFTSSATAREQGYEAGACLCISKPASVISFRNMLNALLSSDLVKDKEKFRTRLSRVV